MRLTLRFFIDGFVFSVLTLSGVLSYAQTKKPSLLDQKVYVDTKSMCSSGGSLLPIFNQASDAAFEAAFKMMQFNIVQARNYVRNRGLSSVTSVILQSPGYDKALTNCYGDDLLRKNIFTATLLFADATATEAGFVFGSVIGFRLMFRVFPTALGVVLKQASKFVQIHNAFKNKYFAMTAIQSIIIIPAFLDAKEEHLEHQEEIQMEDSLLASRIKNIEELYTMYLEQKNIFLNSKTASDKKEVEQMAAVIADAVLRFESSHEELSSENTKRILTIKNDVLRNLNQEVRK